MTTKTEEIIEFKNDLPVKVPQYLKEIDALKAKYSGLALTDVNDKEQLKAIRGARIEFKNARVGVEKYMKGVRDGANAFSKTVIAKEKEIVALIQPEETRLEAEEAKYEAEQLRLAEIKRKEEEAIFHGRVQELYKLGFGMTEQGYGLRACYITPNEIRLMDGPTWEKMMVGEVKQAYDLDQSEKIRIAREEQELKEAEEKQRIEEETRRKEEAARLEQQRKEQEAEQKRLHAIHAEQLKKVEELEARERELTRIENERITAEKKKADEAKRAKELEEAKARAAEEERKRIEQEAKDKEAAAALKKQRDAEKEARKPDKKKLIEFAMSLLEMPIPECKTPQMKYYANGIKLSLKELSERIRKEVGEVE